MTQYAGYLGLVNPPWGGPGGWYLASAIYVGVGGTWRLADTAWVGDTGSWKEGPSPAPLAPTSVGLRVCRATKAEPSDPTPTSWTAAATWSRAAQDADRSAVLEWYVAPYISGPESLVLTENVGTANSSSYALTVPVGETRTVRYRVRIGLAVEPDHSDWVWSPLRTADHDNLDPLCPVDPL